MPIAFHLRTEPRTRSDDLAAGLAARVYDPAWTLARQWQLGELNGDSGGTPVRVRHTGESIRCNSYRDAGGDRPYDPDDGPVEAWAEAGFEPPDRWTARRRVDVGRTLVRALRAAGLDDRVEALAAAFPLELAGTAGPSAQLLALAGGRVPDGAEAYRILEPGLRASPPTVPSTPPLDELVVDDALVDAAVSWLGHCDAILGTAADGAWDAGRLEHHFSVTVPGPSGGVELVADAHPGGSLDWWSFDARTLPADATAARQAHDAITIPTAAAFRGMPTPRWWQEEDASIDLGGVDAHPADLARMALLQFALVYGNDHFVVPVRLAVGSVFRTSHVLVTDTFGVTTSIRPAADPATGAGRAPGATRWTMFTLTTAGGAVADVFVLPPSAVHRLSSAPVEEVLLLRDEMANLAWAIEAVVEGDDGRPRRRAEEYHPAPFTDPPDTGMLRYQLGTTVPPHWFPLVPVRLPHGDAPTLEVQPMAFTESDDAEPAGTLVAFGQELADDRIPREGRRLRRDQVLTRWTDGTTHLWRRHQATAGRGEGSSGLRFDAAAHGPTD